MATSDPVVNVFPEGPVAARSEVGAAGAGLTRLHGTGQIFKVADQPAPGLTGPAEMKLSGTVFGEIVADPTGWAAQRVILHESFHIVRATIKDEGGYRPDPGGNPAAFLARPYAQRQNSAPHYEEVVWQYTGQGPTRAVVQGAGRRRCWGCSMRRNASKWRGRGVWR